MSAHTPGPFAVFWIESPAGTSARITGADGKDVAHIPMQWNARGDAPLLAAAPDHALVLYALTCGLARWESSKGDLVVGESRFATTIDEFGCPKVSPVMRDALLRAAGREVPRG